MNGPIEIIVNVHMIRLMIGFIWIITEIGDLQAADSVFGVHVRIIFFQTLPACFLISQLIFSDLN